MKRIVIISILILTNININAQDKTNLQIEIDVVAPQTKSYFYNDLNNVIYTSDIKKGEEGFNAVYGLKVAYDYKLFNKLSVGVLSGFHNDNKQSFSHVRLGGAIKYLFIGDYGYDIYLQLANNFSLNKSKFKSGVNIKLGASYLVYKVENMNYTFSLFWEQNYYNVEGANKLIGFYDEIPRSLTVHSYGIGLGISFL